MSYILYSSIARAGGIDLLLNMESFSHQPLHPIRRRVKGPSRIARLRRRSGRGLIAVGQALTRWGCGWAPAVGGCPSAQAAE